MSALTVYAPARFLSRETREKITAALGAGWQDNYASNIEDKLRVRGEHALAETMLAEIRESMRE